ncbi:signal peptidase I SipW [Neobacillus vireti]|uniref:Signal peptidase I n=1 Tax=Neobacillus vireti LMG 21834 TaxID=1131730 RepID=A0AB94IMY0_9BACI|nr:signal peptidase I [Neobacillus vireti]ETI68435.1 signal peptidase I [Neobacillus vireti LMG 21834]KLT17263.1 signal peptidase [Neobacillus vireti]
MKVKTVKKWMSNIISVILLLVFVLMLFVVVSSKAAGGEPQAFGYQLKTVLSGSMEPGIKTGSIIVVKPTADTKRFKKNDVITFKEEENKLITHRIVEVIKDGETVMYRTKGDNNKTEDMNPVLSENVVAMFTGFTIPYLGYFTEFSKSKQGNALLLILPGILLLLYSVFTIWKTISKLEKDNKSSSQDTEKSIS